MYPTSIIPRPLYSCVVIFTILRQKTSTKVTGQYHLKPKKKLYRVVTDKKLKNRHSRDCNFSSSKSNIILWMESIWPSFSSNGSFASCGWPWQDTPPNIHMSQCHTFPCIWKNFPIRWKRYQWWPQMTVINHSQFVIGMLKYLISSIKLHLYIRLRKYSHVRDPSNCPVRSFCILSGQRTPVQDWNNSMIRVTIVKFVWSVKNVKLWLKV